MHGILGPILGAVEEQGDKVGLRVLLETDSPGRVICVATEVFSGTSVEEVHDMEGRGKPHVFRLRGLQVRLTCSNNSDRDERERERATYVSYYLMFLSSIDPC